MTDGVQGHYSGGCRQCLETGSYMLYSSETIGRAKQSPSGDLLAAEVGGDDDDAQLLEPPIYHIVYLHRASLESIPVDSTLRIR